MYIYTDIQTLMLQNKPVCGTIYMLFLKCVQHHLISGPENLKESFQDFLAYPHLDRLKMIQKFQKSINPWLAVVHRALPSTYFEVVSVVVVRGESYNSCLRLETKTCGRVMISAANRMF